MARVVSTNASRSPRDRVPRTLAATTDPMAVSDTASTASATSASINVKPASLLRRKIAAQQILSIAAREPARRISGQAGP
jgi:hypothetical protein